MEIRDEIVQLVKDNAENHIEPDIYKIAIADAFSILDEWELVGRDTVREGEFLKERGELLRNVISRILTPVSTQHEIVSPGDYIIILRKKEQKSIPIAWSYFAEVTMTNQELLERFYRLRQDTFNAIEGALKRDGHHKSYEGRFSIIFPNYFQQDDDAYWIDERWGIELSCYVLGPSRHYGWYGKTFAEALEKAEDDLYKWIAEENALDMAE